MSEFLDKKIVSYEPSEASARHYLDFQKRLAANDPQSPYPQPKSLISSLLRNKFVGLQRQFIAVDQNAQWNGHVVARVSPTLTDESGLRIGMLGFFAAMNKPKNIGAMLDAANQWLAAQGCNTIIGPIDGDTWHSYRFNVGPHDEAIFLSEPSNPDYYPGMWRDAGFGVIDRYHSKVIDDISNVIPVIKPVYEKAISQGYTFRHLNLDQFEAELAVIYRLSTEVFRDNFLYDEISFDEFQSLYVAAKRLIDPELVWFALDSTGKEIGFLFCIVDFAPAIAAMEGRQDLWAKLKFWWRARRLTTVNFKSIGVLPEHRRSSVAAALMYQGYVNSLAKGFRRANLCLIRDGNPSSKLDGDQSRLLRRYELYQRVFPLT